ncbi:MAG: type I DNA topoisomerase [Chloroflexi bacterium]|nr:type I DNA topoisomerase [Chloroflexota bacterium]
MEAYCVKCKTKREMLNPTPVFTRTGAPGTRGVCAVCGTNLFRMGATPAHEGLEKPKPEPKTQKKTTKKTTSRSKRGASKRKSSGKNGARKGKLVIVESPAKARTVGKFLGRGYSVKASVGHVRDLYKSKLSVDVEHDFKPLYIVPRDKKKIVRELKEAVAGAEEVYLATDPDREGEAIAWHVAEAVGLEPERTRRVVFHEITKRAVTEAFQQARDIDMNLVDAQQARRVLDRLVGYQVSPLLWRNVKRGLSAGRVQSVALRLIVEREREIQAFVPEEYWSITAELAKQEPERRSFKAKLHRIRGKEFKIATGEEAHALVAELEQAAWEVTKVKRGERKRRPFAPFTTSTLQQDASRRLGFNARRTMRVAQSLYEGVRLGEQGRVGLITYMRTDSVNVSREAQAQARDYIREQFGEAYAPAKPPFYRTKARSAQEAHEAIRPTSVMRTPESVKSYLNDDQFKLYQLIWRRFVASQMTPAIYDTLTVEVKAGPQDGPKPYLFRATGSSVRFPGFLRVYDVARSEENAEENGLGIDIPPLTVGEMLDLLQLLPEQHFTQPPPRYSEAMLVKALEEYGIGRPSTYATIISTIIDRGYVERQKRRLHPTKLGFVVNDLLVQHFDSIFEVGFTARMEEELDRIARGEEEWVDVLREFYAPFSQLVKEAGENMQRQRLEPEKIGEPCPECGADLVLRDGRYGRFIGCSNYPECKYTRPLVVDTGVKCPKDGGRIVQKRSRKGRIFYGCDNWPECDFVTWNPPLNVICPQCRKNILTKVGKRAKCADSECGFSMPLAEAEKLAKAVKAEA